MLASIPGAESGKMMQVRLALHFVIGMVASVATPPSAEACSCVGTLPSSAAVKAADVIFVGTVARIEDSIRRRRTNQDGSNAITGHYRYDP